MNKSSIIIRFMAVFYLVSGVAFGMQQAQSLSQYPFNSASVLPFTYFNKKGKQVKYVILGREAGGRDKGTYDDFGGSKEQNEKHPMITAAREFYEEGIVNDTLGWNLTTTRAHIDLNQNHTEAILALGTAVTYITHFSTNDIINFRKKFEAARAKQTSWKYKEKDRIATVRWDALVAAITNSKNNTGVTVQARLIDPATGKDEAQLSTITLRPFLVKRLRPYVTNQHYQQGKSPKIRFY